MSDSMDIELTAEEARVLACLGEKEATTPDYYPMTVNGLVSACNQKSNREPVMYLDEKSVSRLLDSLRYDHHLVWQVTSSGSRTQKYKHDMVNVIGLTDGELAILCVLMLRGPQTVGELRSRTARHHEFAGLTEVSETMESMQHRESGPLVIHLAREPGRRERRYAHLLCGAVEIPQCAEQEMDESHSGPTRGERLASLEQEVATLRSEVIELKEQLAQFRSQFE